MHTPGKRLAAVWHTDRFLSVLLLLLVIVTLVLPPGRLSGRAPRAVLDLTFLLLFVSGVLAVSRSLRVALAASAVALAAIVSRVTAALHPSVEAASAKALCMGAFTALLAAMVLVQVFREGPITFHRIVGAVAVYLLIGVTFAEVYVFLFNILPGSLASSGSNGLDPDSLLYFSIVTLTTLGYGDITAVHPVVRSVVLVEALTGQLFPAILIARLVSMELLSRDAGRR